MRYVSLLSVGFMVLSGVVGAAWGASRGQGGFAPWDPPGWSNRPAAVVSNAFPAKATAAPRPAQPEPPRIAATNAVELRYQKILEVDDAAQAEVDRWIRDNTAFAGQGAGVSQSDLNKRIRDRLAPVRREYEDFLRDYPNHARARVAYGSFLGDTGDEDGAREQWQKALDLDPKNPAIYNNLANIYSHSGPVKKAFEFLDKAIELNPREPVYYHNLGTITYLFRKDAQEHYQVSQDEIFAKAFQFYSNAMRLDPGNFPLASDVAQTYYGITPMRTEDALQAWTNAFAIANDQIERDGVNLHFGRIKLMAGRFDEARAHIQTVTNAMYTDLKARLLRNVAERQEATQTNTAPRS